MGKKNTSPEILSKELSGIINDIWKNGLTEDDFCKLINIFIQNDDLDLVQRKLILECLVPQFVIKEKIVNDLILWYFSKYIEDPESCAHLMSWVAALTECKLMERCTLEKFYGQLATTFQSECLINALSRVLKMITNKNTVNNSTAFLIQKFYKCYHYHHSVDFKLLLWEVNKYHALDKEITLNSQPNERIKRSDFEKTIMKRARMLGIEIQTDDVKDENLIVGTLPKPEYAEDCAPPYKELTKIANASELGLYTRKLWIEFPENPVSLLNSRIGMIYLELFGPSEEFLVGLKALITSKPSLLVVKKLSELQNRLRHGLPIVTHYLARFLVTWDGLNEVQLVYDLVKWVHFDDFNDLSSRILVPLSRIYICSNTESKVGILNALSSLLINMVTVHMKRFQEQSKFNYIGRRPKWLDHPLDTFNKFCTMMKSLIMIGLVLDGLDSSSIILEAVKFYNIIITLQLKYKLICFITPLPPVMHATLTSLNHVVISEVCSLIVRYKNEVIPFIDSIGRAQDFSADIEFINETAYHLYNYLWHGYTSGSPESIGRSSEKVRKHPGVFPLVEFLSRKLKINPKKLKKSDLLLMLSTYADGLGEFINMMESSLNDG
ncbi:hypothetical protein O3M35_006684 [Rhynocoris fuscipes]|uniref:Centromere protein I n=1 Tax=Rhynocoris fuscipes TaxID=488301 RepID=A0AAW1DE95_9HEMI